MNKEAIQLDIRPLEANNLFTLRHINSLIHSHWISEKNGKGKIVIELDIVSGLENGSDNGGQQKKENAGKPNAKQPKKDGKAAPIPLPEPKTDPLYDLPTGHMELPLLYNENIIKYNKNGATELILKFVIASDKIFLDAPTNNDGSSSNNDNDGGGSKVNNNQSGGAAFQPNDLADNKPSGDRTSVFIFPK